MLTRRIACFLLFLSVCLFAQPSSIESIGIRAGAVSPSIANVSTFSLGFRGENGAHAASVFFQPYFDYWAAHWRTHEIDWNWRFLSAGISAVNKFHIRNVRPMPFLGGGLGINLNLFSTTQIGDRQPADKNNADVDLSLHGLAGFLFPLDANFTAFIEIKYVAAGRVDYAGLWVGLNYQIKAR